MSRIYVFVVIHWESRDKNTKYQIDFVYSSKSAAY